MKSITLIKIANYGIFLSVVSYEGIEVLLLID